MLVFLLQATKLFELPLLRRLDSIFYDMQTVLTMPRGVDPRIVVVDLDEKSLAEREKGGEGRWPWPRDRLALLLDKLFEHYQIAIVGFDVVFAERDESSGIRVLEQLAQNELRGVSQFHSALKQLQPQLDYDAMFASIGEGIIATDRHGNVVMVNAAAESMLGYASRELVGSSYSEIELVDEKGRPVVRARRPIFRALKAGRRVTVEPSDMEWSYVRKDRQPIPVSITASPIAFRGKTIGVIEVFRDIRKEVEQDRILQDFISIASHQLRSPLTGIYWILERVLREERLSKEGRQNLDDVYLLTRNLNELVSLMLNASRIDAGKIPLVVERIDAVKATRRHLAGYQPLCDRKGVVCALEDHPSTLKVRTVPALFSLIVEALISNAIDYTATGGRVGVCIEVKRSRFVLTVRDTGIGIPEQDHARVFQKFYRGSNAVLVKPGGTGLGLYSVRQAAQLLGGSVRFESKVGQGTAFYVELPLETKVSKGR